MEKRLLKKSNNTSKKEKKPRTQSHRPVILNVFNHNELKSLEILCCRKLDYKVRLSEVLDSLNDMIYRSDNQIRQLYDTISLCNMYKWRIEERNKELNLEEID